ncbi:hypothetical protein QR98_0020670 [Sarcoptes scabiei]|uniref:Uncharacterized protein n=1 Tax=Sarcoptes scabiei TaxID=52283 RepID=A0A131ZY64_SARSC|nr:hypothetical protein QR98_0020670 [Sarcoptes scabiei]
MPITALLCDKSSSFTVVSGWPVVFYLFGFIGLIWSLIWFVFIHESPEMHPSISHEELELILENRNYNSAQKVQLMIRFAFFFCLIYDRNVCVL